MYETIDTKEETLLCEDTGSIAAFKTTVKFEEGTKEFSIRFYKDEETEVSYEYRFFVEEIKLSLTNVQIIHGISALTLDLSVRSNWKQTKNMKSV